MTDNLLLICPGYGYRCPVCSKNFANIATIRGHYKYTHWLDLPPREEIENWRIGTGNLAQDEVEEVQQQHQPEHHQQVVILQAHPLSQHSVQVQQSLIPVHHVVEEAGSNFHFIMQPHHQPQSHPQSHQEPPPHQQQHTSMNMGQGLRMPVGGGGVSLSQITMGTLIGHMPVGTCLCTRFLSNFTHCYLIYFHSCFQANLKYHPHLSHPEQ